MNEFPTQPITIYHKNQDGKYEIFIKEASIRNVSMLKHSKNGFESNNNVILRIFDVKGYNKSIFIKNTSSTLNCPLNSFLGETWKISQGDIVVNGKVDDEIKTTTLNTELSKKYGKENVFKVNNINVLIFNDDDIEELNHVKLGCI